MFDGVKCFCEAEVDLDQRVPLLHQTGYTFFQKDAFLQTRSTGKEAKFVLCKGLCLCKKQKQNLFEQTFEYLPRCLPSHFNFLSHVRAFHLFNVQLLRSTQVWGLPRLV